jgi:hypothetical protein
MSELDTPATVTLGEAIMREVDRVVAEVTRPLPTTRAYASAIGASWPVAHLAAVDRLLAAADELDELADRAATEDDEETLARAARRYVDAARHLARRGAS